MTRLPSGVGLAWRPETAWAVDQRPTLAFTEIIAESVPRRGPLPGALEQLLERGVTVIPHGVSLSLGSGDPPDAGRLRRLREVARRLHAPCVSEHVAFVRGGGHDTEHLFPVPRTRQALAVVADNVRRAQDQLHTELVLENIAHLFAWPDDEMDEATFLGALVERTGCRLLLDVSNLHANCVNYGWSAGAYLDRLPLDRVAYVHVAGGITRDGFYYDTHAHPVGQGPRDLLAELLRRRHPLPILLERDDGFDTREALDAELDLLEATLRAVEASHVVA